MKTTYNNQGQIDNIRLKIDKIDDEILDLITVRSDLAMQMKLAKGDAPIYSPTREVQILRRMQANNKSHFAAAAVQAIFSEIIGASRNLERRLKISYLGPEGTYSHEAAQAMFGSTSDFVPQLTLSEVIKLAETESTDSALLPIENSSEGAVIQTHRLLLTTPLQIIGEFTLKIQHCLLSKATSFEDITSVHAHPQALGQCREWLQINLPKAHLVSETSNSYAAQVAVNNQHSAAIASQRAATFANIPVLVKGINDFANNKTRFIALSNFSPTPTKHDKTSIICSVGDKVGALYDLLAVFAKYKISLTRLESQPQPDHVYAFYIDFEGHRDTPEIARALLDLAREAKTCKVLGSYPMGS